MVLSNQYFYNVASLALQALGSPECAALYNTSGRGDFTPQMVLQSMIAWGIALWLLFRNDHIWVHCRGDLSTD